MKVGKAPWSPSACLGAVDGFLQLDRLISFFEIRQKPQDASVILPENRNVEDGFGGW